MGTGEKLMAEIPGKDPIIMPKNIPSLPHIWNFSPPPIRVSFGTIYSKSTGGRPNLLSRPQVVGACHLSFSPVPPSQGGAGWGFLGRPSMKNLFTKYPIICEKIYFEGSLCYPASHQMIWPKKRNLWGLNPGWKVPNPFFARNGQASGIISGY